METSLSVTIRFAMNALKRGDAPYGYEVWTGPPRTLDEPASGDDFLQGYLAYEEPPSSLGPP